MSRGWIAVLLAACSSDPALAPTADSAVGDAPVDTAMDVSAEVTCAPLARTAIAGLGPMTVVGDTGSTLGVFDPSTYYPKDAPAGVMSYSSVPSQEAIFTRIAVSSDKGSTWTYVADANAPSDVSGMCDGAMCTGRLISEVTAIVADPTDTPERRYKLFLHTYFVYPGTTPVKLRYDWGYIGLQTAPEPKGPWSRADKLLGWTSTMPSVSSEGALQKLTDIAELAKCVAFTEPSAIVTPTTIELALGCVEVATPPTIRIVLLRSTDRAKTFSLVGTLLQPNDGACAGSSVPQVNAAHLFDVGGKPYLLASTAGTVPPGFTGYNGCAVYEIEDLVTARIRRKDGAPVIARFIDPGGRFGGACSYAEGASANGYVISALAGTSPIAFRMYATGVAAP